MSINFVLDGLRDIRLAVIQDEMSGNCILNLDYCGGKSFRCK